MSDTGDYQTAENKSQIEDAITRFERQFARDHSTRIESFLDDQDSDNGNQPLKENPELVAELIYVEMDLRHEQGQEFTQLEYLQRFPQFKDVVADAWKRLPNVTKKFVARDDDLIVSIHKTSIETGTIAELIVDKQGISEVPEQIGKYKNLSFIAKGGFGLVYKALDEDSKQHVALKFPRMRRQNGRIVDSGAMQMIFEEASKSSHLDHPGIVRTIATETIDKFVFVVQEFVDGQDLRSSLTQKRSHVDVAQLIAKIAEALGYANLERIVHRDLKPANILLTKNDEPKITDFGLAFHDSIQVDLPDGRCGTPHYMSPELVQGLNKQLDGRTDIWSLGVIFYELLAGERPFIGKNETEIFKQIETRDPKPLRQIDPSIDLELEWICLKCLEKRPSDRFGVAKDLADHLWKWIDNQLVPDETTNSEQSDTPTHTRKETAILPRGLRSYGREDAEAFMQLLPGLRDHKGVPSSIRFWQVRIREPVADENRVPVGVIYGPSGSGKSSFVKAGLLPNLGNSITSVYVESTREDTEVRIIKALRRRYPDIPYDKSLPQIFSGLVDGDWGTARQKILIVIDQLEQRLSINDDYDQSQLAKAIKHCDGQRVQCLLLVRDDFWIGLTRFTEAIEMNLLVGQNSQDIDLFDKKHARNVLVKLGQAYNRLPHGKQFESLSKNEKAFIKEAVEQLSDGNQVICVRLALFAEMFKDRDWTREELKKVGGVQGVGETFLESTFGSESKSKKYQLQKNAAQAVLSELLPDTGTDIRGSMKSEADLRHAAGLDDRPERFKELIDTLDNELKLITRTSPDDAESGTTNDDSPTTNEKSNHFQLTHDFLVPTIRNWLDSELKKTRSGRARIRLRELALQVKPNGTPKHLPSNLEWISWQFMFSKKGLSRAEHAILSSAQRRFLRSLTFSAAALVIVLLIASILYAQIVRNNQTKNVRSLVDKLESENVRLIPGILRDLEGYQRVAKSELLARHDAAGVSKNERERLSLGLLLFDSKQSEHVVNSIIEPESNAQKVKVYSQLLSSHGSRFTEILESVFFDENIKMKQRLRAASALAFVDKAFKLNGHESFIVDSLSKDYSSDVHEWLELLQSQKSILLPEFHAAFSAASSRSETDAYANSIYAFENDKNKINALAAFIPDSNTNQFDSVLRLVEKNQIQREFGQALIEIMNSISSADLADISTNDKSQLAKLWIALIRLEPTSKYVQKLKDNSDNLFRLYFVSNADNAHIAMYQLRNAYVAIDPKLDSQDDLAARRILLQAFAEYALHETDPALVKFLIDTAKKHLVHDHDACCFSTALLVLERLNQCDNISLLLAERRKLSPNKNGILGNILVNSKLMPFSLQRVVISGTEKVLAISITELTNFQMHEFLQQNELDSAMFTPKNNLPFSINGRINEVFLYCNWLSKQDQIFEDKDEVRIPCYPSKIAKGQIFSIHPETIRIFLAFEYPQQMNGTQSKSHSNI